MNAIEPTDDLPFLSCGCPQAYAERLMREGERPLFCIVCQKWHFLDQLGKYARTITREEFDLFAKIAEENGVTFRKQFEERKNHESK